MLGQVVEFADLQKLSGYERRGDVERWAKANGIPLRLCRSGVWTTLHGLNTALGIASTGNDEHYPPDLI